MDNFKNFDTFENVDTESTTDFICYFQILQHATVPMDFWDKNIVAVDQQYLTANLARLAFDRKIPVPIMIKFLIPNANGFAFNKNYADPTRKYFKLLDEISSEYGKICD